MYASLNSEMSKGHNNTLLEHPAKTKDWGRGVQPCSLRVTVLQSFSSNQGWTGNLAYRAFSRWADALSGRYMFFLNIQYIYIYSSKCWWAAWTKKMPGPIFLSQSSPGSNHNQTHPNQLTMVFRLTRNRVEACWSQTQQDSGPSEAGLNTHGLGFIMDGH